MSQFNRSLLDRPRASLTDRLQSGFGGIWTGVTFRDEPVPTAAQAKHDMRLCEAVARSFLKPIVLAAHQIGCPGARWALGLAPDDHTLARQMSQKAGLPFDTLYKVLAETPRLEPTAAAVSFGVTDDVPNVVVGYLQPKEAMTLLRQWHVRHGRLPTVPLSSFLAICAWVVVRALILDELCVSFGCFDSRQFGGIGSDTLVVGMPSVRAEQLVLP